MSDKKLTNMQSLMLAGQRLCPESPLYNMAFRFDISGGLDPAKLQRAIETVIQANEVLGLRIADQGTTSFQHPGVEHLDAKIVDAKQLPNGAAQPFDLSAGCLQTSIHQIGSDHYVWYLNKHHLITDGASFLEFFRQVAHVYSGNKPHSNSFARYQAAIEKVRKTQRYIKAQAYWSEKYSKHQGSISLGTSNGPTNATNVTHRSTLQLSAQERLAIGRVASDPMLQSISPQLTEFSILAATLLLLRYRLYGPESTTLGMPMHGNARDTIGPTLEVGFIDVSLETTHSFIDLVRAVQHDTLSAMQHCLPGVTSAQVNSSFSWLLNYLPGSIGTFAGLPCTTEWLHSGAGDAAQELRVQVHDLNATGGLTLHFDAATRAFTAHQRATFPGLFRALLRACLNDPTTPNTLLQFGSPVLSEAPQPPQPPAQNLSPTLIGKFQQLAIDTPNAIALKSSDGTEFTFVELDKCSSRLAAAHESLEHWVLLLRGPAAVVAILAALKSNKPFVPLDIEHPNKRINSILDQLNSPPVFVLPSQLGRQLNAKDQYLVDLTSAQAKKPSANERQTVAADLEDTPEKPAYIIFTSGTTGTPKGVVVGRASLANYINWAAGAYSEQAPVTMPFYSSLAFDLTLTSILLPLFTGGCVVTYGDTPGSSALSILHVMRDGATEVIKLTPSHLRLALSSRDVDTSNLRCLILGGEDLSRSLALEAADRLGQPAIYNEYGPTEATIGCMIHRFDPVKDRSASVPIGKPISNATIELIDYAGQPTPQGFDGQLVLGGVPVAQSYWEGQQLTGSGYHSGDRARLLEDGNMLYLGRIDTQVKFRGARIELAEIENKLKATGLVQACVAKITESNSTAQLAHCKQCGIANNVPRVVLNANDICNVCEDYEKKSESLAPYFRPIENLRSAISQRTSAESEIDCVVLVSGGKDSSFTLCKIVELGLRPIAFTLDNGYLSQHALDNVERMTTKLGVPWIKETPPQMRQIFNDSLVRHSNVCNGCFKTIYTLSINYALEHEISSIVTGLSRGQLFETRLLDMVDTEVFDPEVIDRRVKQARIAYHTIDDAISQHLNVTATRKNETFDTVEFFDFYRYCDASLDEMLDFLREFGGWERPPDTGRSTNCLINDVGIYVHQTERAHHNYAVPYAWDVRMGHKTRPQAVHELNDELDMIRVHEILDEIDYTPETPTQPSEEQLAAYYEPMPGAANIQEALREALRDQLPDYSLPTHFVELDTLPLTGSGKVDHRALPAPNQQQRTYVAPATDLEQRLALLWSRTLLVDGIGRHDNYFELGGDSISAVQLAILCTSEELPLEPIHFFNHPTVSELAQHIETVQSIADGRSAYSDKAGTINNEPDTGLSDEELNNLLNNTINPDL